MPKKGAVISKVPVLWTATKMCPQLRENEAGYPGKILVDELFRSRIAIVKV